MAGSKCSSCGEGNMVLRGGKMVCPMCGASEAAPETNTGRMLGAFGKRESPLGKVLREKK